MNAVVKNIVLNATKAQGKCVEKVMDYVADMLTPSEYTEVEAFLTWCFKKNNKSFGWATIDDRVKEFEASK